MSELIRVGYVFGGKGRQDCFPLGTVSPATPSDKVGQTDSLLFPLEMDLHQMCKWFYGVKRWSVLITGQWTDHREHDPFPSGPPSDTPRPFSIYFDFAFTQEVQDDSEEGFHDSPLREQDFKSLIESYSYDAFILTNLYNLETFKNPDVKNVVLAGVDVSVLEMGIQPGFIKFQEDSFYPQFFFQLSLQDGISGIAVISSNNLAYTPSDLAPIGYITMDDLTTTLFYKNFHGPGAVDYSNLDFCDAVIQPLTFFDRYANKDGDQVYDKDTGAQLVDPFS